MVAGRTITCPASGGVFGMGQIIGTSAAETLTGTDVADLLEGNGGGDVIEALGGDDIIYVGDGTDTVDAGDGDDFVTTTGGGDDVIHLGLGDDDLQVSLSDTPEARTVTIEAGAGHDALVLNDDFHQTNFLIDAGEGGDEIRLQSFGQATVGAGAGDDVIFQFNGWSASTITFGDGRDTLFLWAQGWYGDLQATIQDFQVSGPSADRLDLAEFLLSGTVDGAVLTSNPFAAGYMRLVQSGADTLIQAVPQNAQPGEYATFIRLVGVNAVSLTAESFSGFDPHSAALPSGVQIAGGTDRDRLYGSLYGDHLQGGDGDDYLEGSGGFDTLEGQGGNDRLFGRGADGQTMLGGDGDDDLTFMSWPDLRTGADHPVLMEGGAGRDYLQLDTRYMGVGVAFEATLRGGDDNDQLITYGERGATLEGGEGDDWLGGGPQDDRLDGGAGQDTLNYNYSTGAVAVDLAIATAQDTHGAGVDTITGVENLQGSDFGDTLWGDNARNELNGLVGDDVLQGRGGDDLLVGEAGNDELHGGAGVDTLRGGTGDDLFDGGTGGELAGLSLGVGDVAYFRDRETSVTVDLSHAGPQDTGFGLDSFINIEEVWGGFADDSLTGDDLSNRLAGYEGADQLHGGGGDDLLIGGTGDDLLDGGAGLDIVSYQAAESRMTVDLGAGTAQSDYGSALYGIGIDTLVSIDGVLGSIHGDTLIGHGGDNVLSGEAGDDLLRGLAGDDVLNGGDDVDTADFSDATVGLTIDLNVVVAQDTGDGRDTLIGVESLIGSGQDDLLTGDAAANVFTAGAGQDWLVTNGGGDTLIGGDGHDSLWGGAGDDLIEGGAGDDTLFGGAGSDTASYATALGSVRIDLTNLEDQNTGGAGFDTLVSIENIVGSDYADVLIGNASDNIIGGRTTWVGGGDDPTRFMGDVMTGGGGNDVFVFSRPEDASDFPTDRITDFSRGDRIDFSAFDMDIWTTGRQGLHFGQTEDHRGDVQVSYYEGTAIVSVYTNDDLSSDMIFYVSGSFGTLTASDFIF
jgi:Ca2+-binding RTX toxin-like protein